MFFDNYGALNMEHVPFPGSIGDSCAETSRYYLLNGMTFEQMDKVYKAFVTKDGYVRHPDSPWREDDFSGDQALPLYILFHSFGMYEWREEFERRVRDSGWKTGNGDLVSLLFISVIRKANKRDSWFTDLPLLIQIIAMRFLPYRWNDERKWFERTSDSSADWLNYFHALKFALVWNRTWVARLASWLTPHDLFMSKIKSYYSNEPNSQDVVAGYERGSLYR